MTGGWGVSTCTMQTKRGTVVAKRRLQHYIYIAILCKTDFNRLKCDEEHSIPPPSFSPPSSVPLTSLALYSSLSSPPHPPVPGVTRCAAACTGRCIQTLVAQVTAIQRFQQDERRVLVFLHVHWTERTKNYFARSDSACTAPLSLDGVRNYFV